MDKQIVLRDCHAKPGIGPSHDNLSYRRSPASSDETVRLVRLQPDSADRTSLGQRPRNFHY
ncbi:hypothetical protein LMG28140_05394 [Paraburkholderia metrosideri]|uniref:Uncharacterized protein n=1 Tax=Paraburkholderia metrosideri TaxID=580937 RepID=A0ABM8P1X2_9BURK|nr:hypothetical protein LMG28140_05394 [Paraburkholderia metrosideri]